MGVLMWLMLLVVGCKECEAPKQCQVCDDCDEKVRKELEQQAVSIEDGPWLIKDDHDTILGRAFAVKGELGLEVFDAATDGGSLPFLSDAVTWHVSVDDSVAPSCSTADKCIVTRASFDQADVDAEINNPCVNDACAAPSNYHADGTYRIEAVVGTGSPKVAYYKVAAGGGGWNEQIWTDRGRPFPWPNDGVSDDPTPGGQTTWKISWASGQMPTNFKRWREYTVKPG